MSQNKNNKNILELIKSGQLKVQTIAKPTDEMLRANELNEYQEQITKEAKEKSKPLAIVPVSDIFEGSFTEFDTLDRRDKYNIILDIVKGKYLNKIKESHEDNFILFLKSLDNGMLITYFTMQFKDKELVLSKTLTNKLKVFNETFIKMVKNKLK